VFEKKLSTKVIVGRVKPPEKAIKLYSIIGVCTGMKTGESQYGGWVGFTGTFEAVRFSDGKAFAGAVAFIPEPASSMMLNALGRAEAQNGVGSASIEFAFIVGAKPSDKASGFEYTVEPVLNAKQNDALSELRKLMAPKLPALPKA
jgi:hypothetical protein